MFTHLKSRLSLGYSLIGDLLAKYDLKNRQLSRDHYWEQLKRKRAGKGGRGKTSEGWKKTEKGWKKKKKLMKKGWVWWEWWSKVNLTKEVVFALGRVGTALALKRKEDKLHWRKLLAPKIHFPPLRIFPWLGFANPSLSPTEHVHLHWSIQWSNLHIIKV